MLQKWPITSRGTHSLPSPTSTANTSPYLFAANTTVCDTHVTQLNFFGDTNRHRSSHAESTSYTYRALSSPPTAKYLPVGLNFSARMTFAGPSGERTSSACTSPMLILFSVF